MVITLDGNLWPIIAYNLCNFSVFQKHMQAHSFYGCIGHPSMLPWRQETYDTELS